MNKRFIQIITLYRYYLYAVIIRDNLIYEKPNELIDNLYDDASKLTLIFYSHIGVYMTLYYSSLFLVIEGWIALKLSDTRIDELIKSPYVTRLKRFRNATFHFQKEPLSPKLLQFFGTKEEVTEKWISDLFNEFGRFFKENREEVPSDLLKELDGKSHNEIISLIQKYYIKN